jgi:peroxiredoxin
MGTRLSSSAALGLAVLAAFTVFITWRAKRLESAMLERARTPALTNKDAPPFELPSLDGRTISLADYRGKKKLVVSFWASWCGPCRMEMPSLRAFYDRYHKNSNFEILAISIDERQRDAEDFVNEQKLPFPVLLDLRSKVAEAYGVEGIPVLFVIDENGKVIYGHEGVDQLMEFQLAQHLGIKIATPGMEGTPDGTSSH